LAHLQHKHIIVRADVFNPPNPGDHKNLTEWFEDLVSSIKMKILSGPHVVYCKMVGNQGFTGVCAIETSHIALHIWDEESPGRLELDVYTCSDLDQSVIFDKLQAFSPVNIKYIVLDRQDGQQIIEHVIEKQSLAA
jgi:S-adenosylmethionine/arginine decarboxylase-like enzyme